MYRYVTTTSPPQSPAEAPLISQQASFDNDLYETYDPLSRYPRRQQQQPQQYILQSPPLLLQQQRQTSRPSTSGSGTTRTTPILRRTPKFDERSNPKFKSQSASAVEQPIITGVRQVAQFFPQTPDAPIFLTVPPSSQPQSDQTRDTTTTTATLPISRETWWPKRTTRISKRTANAILYALEEAIRTPLLFTSDKFEEEALMADLAGSVGQARVQNGRTTNTGSSTLPVPSTGVPRVRSPREIMRDRERREALRRLEQEEQNIVRTGRTSDQAAGVGEVRGGNGGENRRSSGRQPYVTNSQEINKRTVEPGSREYVQSMDAQGVASVPIRGETYNHSADNGASSATVPKQQSRIGRTATKQNNQTAQQQHPTRPALGQAAAPTRNPSDGTRPQATTNNQARNSSTSFPHAFERWETLSSHWEGLTSFWIKRLQGNSEELSGQPINQQLARQVTDLSAAGANLFHAVVELQRLRASSERKFQRWFFETRTDQEKATERIAQLEAELSRTRQDLPVQPQAPLPTHSPEKIRRQAERLAADEIEKVKRHCALEIKEKNRELEISREEARRGWEEIGRMEQENRDRTFSLRRGEPTIVGGVQVVPLQTDNSRTTSRQTGGLSSHPPTAEEPGYTGHDTARSETNTDPFTDSSRDAQAGSQGLPTAIPLQPPSSSAAIQAARPRSTSASLARPQTAGQPIPPSRAYATQPLTAASAGGFYQQSGAGTTLHPQSTRAGQDERSYVTSEPSEDDYQVDENGQILRDQQGNLLSHRTNPSSEISDEYDVLERMERDQLLARAYPASYAQASDHEQDQRFTTASNGGSYQAPADYSGSGYEDRDWQSAVPRHHHPSRLSDVLEEDERSRTSETSRRVYH